MIEFKLYNQMLFQDIVTFQFHYFRIKDCQNYEIIKGHYFKIEFLVFNLIFSKNQNNLILKFNKNQKIALSNNIIFK